MDIQLTITFTAPDDTSKERIKEIVDEVQREIATQGHMVTGGSVRFFGGPLLTPYRLAE